MLTHKKKRTTAASKQRPSTWTKIKQKFITLLRSLPYIALGLSFGFFLRDTRNVMNDLPACFHLLAALIGLLGGLYLGVRTEATGWIGRLLACLGLGAFGCGVAVSGLLFVWGLLCTLNRSVPYGASQKTYQAKIVKRAFRRSRGRFTHTNYALHLFLPARKAIYVYDSKPHFFRYKSGQDCVLHTRVGFLGIETMENLTVKPSPKRPTSHLSTRP